MFFYHAFTFKDIIASAQSSNDIQPTIDTETQSHTVDHNSSLGAAIGALTKTNLMKNSVLTQSISRIDYLNQCKEQLSAENQHLHNQMNQLKKKIKLIREEYTKKYAQRQIQFRITVAARYISFIIIRVAKNRHRAAVEHSFRLWKASCRSAKVLANVFTRVVSRDRITCLRWAFDCMKRSSKNYEKKQKQLKILRMWLVKSQKAALATYFSHWNRISHQTNDLELLSIRHSIKEKQYKALSVLLNFSYRHKLLNSRLHMFQRWKTLAAKQSSHTKGVHYIKSMILRSFRIKLMHAFCKWKIFAQDALLDHLSCFNEKQNTCTAIGVSILQKVLYGREKRLMKFAWTLWRERSTKLGYVRSICKSLNKRLKHSQEKAFYLWKFQTVLTIQIESAEYEHREQQEKTRLAGALLLVKTLDSAFKRECFHFFQHWKRLICSENEAIAIKDLQEKTKVEQIELSLKYEMKKRQQALKSISSILNRGFICRKGEVIMRLLE